jgi:hypothetical protein
MSRVLALLILCAYFWAGVVAGGWTAVFYVTLFFSIPLACIFWPEVMAEACKGIRTVDLPPGMIFGLGWLVFLLPAVLGGALWLALRNSP